jgi:hypothetical protein
MLFATLMCAAGDALRGYAADTRFYPRAGNLDWAAWRVTMTVTNGTIGGRGPAPSPTLNPCNEGEILVN